MRDAVAEAESRRRFLRLLAASPLLGLSGMPFASSGNVQDAIEDSIAAPEQALNVMEKAFGNFRRALMRFTMSVSRTDKCPNVIDICQNAKIAWLRSE